MARRKLKGKNSENIKDEKKVKMEKTLERMDKVRENDNENLRDSITQRLKWINEQKTKGLELIEKYKKEIEMLKVKIYKLQGAEVTLMEILKPEKENNSDNSEC